MKYQSFALTDPGTAREENQDAIFMEPRLGLYLVCDGGSGRQAGDVASKLTVQAVHTAIQSNVEALKNYVQRPTLRKRLKAMEVVLSAIKTASAQVHSEAASEAAKTGMSSTMALLQLLGNRAVAANVGNSRIYLFRRGNLYRLTEDHTLANQYVRMGAMSPQNAGKSRSAQMVTRAIGLHEHVRPDTLHFDLVRGDLFLLCTDGLAKHVTDEEIAKACRKLSPQEICRQLIAAANRRGGEDNSSVVVVQMAPGKTPKGDAAVLRLQALQRVPLFRHLSFAELLRVMDISQVESYEAGNRIIAEGDRSDRIYVTFAGTVHVVKDNRKLAELSPGSLFGEMGLIDEAPRSADIIAPDGAQVLVIHRSDFYALLRQERTLAVKVLWGMCFLLNGRLRATSAKLSATSAAKQTPLAQPKTRLDELADAARPFV